MNNFTQLLLVEAMIYSGLAIFASYLCCASDAFPLADNLDTKVQEYFVKMKIKDPTPNEEAIARDLIFERHEADEKADRFKEELGNVRSEKKGESDVLWLVRVRSAVEFFQSEHGSDAQYSSQDWTNLKALKNRHERSCLFRELNFKWIFANKQHVHAVADLTNRIQNNPSLGTTDKFSKLIATATSDLSVLIHNYLLTPGKGQYDVEFSTRYAETNEAVKEFWRTFAFAENIVKKVTPTFTMVSTKPSTP